MTAELDLRYVLVGLAVGFAGLAVGVAAAVSPQFAVAGGIGVLFLAIASRSLALGFCIFVVLTFFDRTTAFQAGGLTVVKLAGAVLMLLWLVQATSRTSVPNLIRSCPLLALTTLGLAAWSSASALWAPDPHLALTSSAGSAFRLVQGLLLLFMVFTAFRERRHIWWLVNAFVGGAVVAASVGVIGVYGADRAVNDGRLSGGFDDPNELAAVLLPALVLCGFAFIATRGSRRRWLYAGAAALFLYTLVQTDSQAGIVALVVALLLVVSFSGRARRTAVAGVVAFVLSATCYYTFYTRPVALETIASQDNVGSRETLWTVARRVVADHPVGGVGAGNFVVAEPAYTATNLDLPRADLVVRPELVHNSYLQVLAELGIVGLLAFLAVIGGALRLGRRAAGRFAAAGDWELEMLARGFFIGTIAMLVAYFFATNQYEKQLWLLIAVAPALMSVASARGAAATGKEALQ